jgi:hypothetical protein
MKYMIIILGIFLFLLIGCGSNPRYILPNDLVAPVNNPAEHRNAVAESHRQQRNFVGQANAYAHQPYFYPFLQPNPPIYYNPEWFSFPNLGEIDRRNRIDDMLWEYEYGVPYPFSPPINIPNPELPKFSDFLPDY